MNLSEPPKINRKGLGRPLLRGLEDGAELPRRLVALDVQQPALAALLDRANLTGLVLGCIEAKFGK